MKPFVKRVVFQASRVTLIVVTVSLAVQTYLAGWKKPQPVGIDSRPIFDEHSSPQTLWDSIQQNANLTKFAKLVGEFDDIVGGLRAPRAQLTVYAPTNEAFDLEDFPYDLPWFYWKFLVGYHMGKGGISSEALHSQNTVSSFVNADIFFKNQQRISVQNNADGISFNFHAKLLASQPAVNGHLHVVDRLLMLPDSTADVLRYTATFGTFRQGLIDTGLAEVINDTSTHTAQTVFAPSDAAFRKLGRKVNAFLFGPGGRAYLKALLAYHVVSNETLFSDVHFPTKNGDHIVLDLKSASNQVSLPTLARGHEVSVRSVRHSSKDRRSLSINDEWEVTRPDIVVMDGVIHEIDGVILPPIMNGEDQLDKQHDNWWSVVSRSLNIGGGITVEDLMERLQPLIENEE
ncbi:unnamed protein product [Penicillium salamii]|uniref:FAS1 domain-containing protein n=1 Tax=Penicillium salamii TaxID=1612424 RepID=A0A9W4JKV7_9EURO|nr:unnamed protein product [Penicillium salamii]